MRSGATSAIAEAVVIYEKCTITLCCMDIQCRFLDKCLDESGGPLSGTLGEGY